MRRNHTRPTVQTRPSGPRTVCSDMARVLSTTRTAGRILTPPIRGVCGTRKSSSTGAPSFSSAGDVELHDDVDRQLLGAGLDRDRLRGRREGAVRVAVVLRLVVRRGVVDRVNRADL